MATAADIGDFLSEAGHEVHHAINGIAGLQVLIAHPISLIIVARKALRMSSVDFLQSLRQYAPYVETPVVMIGGTSGMEDVDASFGPSFSEEVFLATVSRLLRRSARPSRTYYAAAY
ncbi:response regulator [uncultured Ferrovibrio sp.]|uniref:response regulator n=1 Tax=uncultured Ferrovibrio sp. TaxID=1576913 RepID=UPI00262A3D5C|nr:response regulator [uncultured Ferrovibrio sp.]